MDTKDKIIQIRTGMGLNQTEFANTIGVSRGIISKVESGDRPATLKLLKKISDIHEIDLEWLQSDSKEPSPASSKDKEYEEYKQIMCFFRDPRNSIRIDMQLFIDFKALNAVDECRSIDVALRNLTVDQLKEIVFSSPATFKYEYETIFEIDFKSFEEFEKHLKSLDTEGLRAVLDANKDEFVKYMNRSKLEKYKPVLRELDSIFSQSIDNDPNINLLIKHRILKPSDLARLHTLAMEMFV